MECSSIDPCIRANMNLNNRLLMVHGLWRMHHGRERNKWSNSKYFLANWSRMNHSCNECLDKEVGENNSPQCVLQNIHRRLGGDSDRKTWMILGGVILSLQIVQWSGVRPCARALGLGFAIVLRNRMKVVLWDRGWSLVVLRWVLVGIKKPSFVFQRI